MKLTTLFLLACSLAFCQTKAVSNLSATGTVNFGGAVSTSPTVVGLTAALPATCTAGNLYFETDATAGSNLLGCTSGNTWTIVGPGGSATGTVTSVATTSPITGGTITTTGTIACATCVTSAASLTLNRLVIGAGSQGTSVLGSLGTSTTLLHGGSPNSYAAVSLSTDVTGVLPIGNGGTGTGSALTGLVRGGSSAFTADELSGDVTTSGSNAATVVAIDGLTWNSGYQTQLLKLTPNSTSNSTALGFTYQAIVEANDYNFPAITPTGSPSLSVGSNNVTIPVAPLGLYDNSDLLAYYGWYTSGGTGTAEVCSVTATTCNPGSTSCSVTVSCGHTHSGAYTFASANGGIHEAANFIANSQGANNSSWILHLNGTYLIYGPAYIGSGSQADMVIDGFNHATLAVQTATGIALDVDGQATIQNTTFEMKSGVTATSGQAMVRIGQNNATGNVILTNNYFYNCYDCVLGVDTSFDVYSDNSFNDWLHTGITCNSPSYTGDTWACITNRNVFGVSGLGTASLAAIAVYGDAFKSTDDVITSDSTSMDWCIYYYNNYLNTSGITISNLNCQSGLSGGIELANIGSHYTQNTSVIGCQIAGTGTGVQYGIDLYGQWQGTQITGVSIQGSGSSYNCISAENGSTNENVYMGGNSCLNAAVAWDVSSPYVTIGPNRCDNVTTIFGSGIGSTDVLTNSCVTPYGQLSALSPAASSTLQVSGSTSCTVSTGSGGTTCYWNGSAWAH